MNLSVTAFPVNFKSAFARLSDSMRSVRMQQVVGALAVAAVLTLTAAPADVSLHGKIGTPMGDCNSDFC